MTTCAATPDADANGAMPTADPLDGLLGAKPLGYQVVDGDNARCVQGGVIDEQLLSIYVNGESLATMMCSPVLLEALAVGFLYNEGVIESADEIGLLQTNQTKAVVDALLTHDDVKLPRRMILTSGCGGGMTGQELSKHHPALESEFVSSTARLQRLMRLMQGAATLYQAVRGVHTAALCHEDDLLLCAEDVGRHNAVDKVAGLALLNGVETRDRLLLTSGRVSSEMVGKARRMGIPIVASRTAPTSVTVELAEAWNICVVGYLRRGGMRVYTHGWRLGLA